MKKGYSIVRFNKKIIININDLNVKDVISIQLYNGELSALIKKKKEV